jgi:hypothetical protein
MHISLFSYFDNAVVPADITGKSHDEAIATITVF